MTASNSNPPEPRFPRVAVEVPSADSEDVSALLFELGASGVEERDQGTLHKSSAEGLVTLLGSFEDDALAQEALAQMARKYRAWLDEVVGDDWRDAWKEHFRAFHLAKSVVVCPPWEQYQPAAGEQVLELEPGRAFGTGLHATTTLVAKALEDLRSTLQGAQVLDVGCGTGILCFVALLFGAAQAHGIDNDADVIPVAMENASRNGLGERFSADTTDVSRVQGKYGVVVANIEARVLHGMARALRERVAPGGVLILSGVLKDQEQDLLAAFAPLSCTAVTSQDEWVAIQLRAGP